MATSSRSSPGYQLNWLRDLKVVCPRLLSQSFNAPPSAGPRHTRRAPESLFDQQLPYTAALLPAHRKTRSDFPRPLWRPRHQQSGHIDAADQQHKPALRPAIYTTAHITRQSALQWHDAFLKCEGNVENSASASARGSAPARWLLRPGDAGLKAAPPAIEPPPSPSIVGRSGVQRSTGSFDGSATDACTGARKPRGIDANHPYGSPPQRDEAAHHAPESPRSAQPEIVAEHRQRRPVRTSSARLEFVAHPGAHAKYAEESGRNPFRC